MRAELARRLSTRSTLLLLCLATATPSHGGPQPPSQFTNGLPGTPNLPSATRPIIDKDMMGVTSDNYTSSSDATRDQNYITINRIQSEQVTVNNFLKYLNKVTTRTPEKKTQQDKQSVQDDFYKFRVLPFEVLYAGTDVRVGQGKPVISSEFLYSSTYAGLDVGLAYYATGYTGIGSAVKQDLTGNYRTLATRSRRLIKALDDARERSEDARKDYDANVQNLLDIANQVTSILNEPPTSPAPPGQDETLTESQGTRLKALIPKVQTIKDEFDTIKDELNNANQELTKKEEGFKANFVSTTWKWRADFLLGYRSATYVGDFANLGGIAVSKMVPVGSRRQGPGLTLSVVGQEFSFYPSGASTISDGRLGLSAVLQDKVPYHIKASRHSDDLALIHSDDGPEVSYEASNVNPWSTKVGVEFLKKNRFAPHNAVTGFLRYRTRNYMEYTFYGGGDGSEGNHLYGGVSVGISVGL